MNVHISFLFSKGQIHVNNIARYLFHLFTVRSQPKKFNDINQTYYCALNNKTHRITFTQTLPNIIQSKNICCVFSSMQPDIHGHLLEDANSYTELGLQNFGVQNIFVLFCLECM